jgi:hypothetical protein
MGVEIMKAYKAFNHNWTCHDFAFEVGKTYTHDGPVKLCLSGFHACEAPLDVLAYYPPTAMFAEVDIDGVSSEKENDTKRVSKSITIKAALSIAGLISAHVEWVSKQADAKASSGNYSKAASSGNYSKAASSGDSSTAASSGNSSTAASSGNSSKAASSGNSSKAEATGKETIAVVAGLNGSARAGDNGAFALPWRDGDQIRIAVGIVGENAKPNVWYRCDDAGKLLEA